MSAAAIAKLSVEEYLAADRVAEQRSEYHDGEIFPVLATSWKHGHICAKVSRRLDERLDGHPCQIATAVRVRISPSKFVYPDVVVVCGEPAFVDGEQDTITNPKVIAEILSPSSADYDYGGKFSLYRRLPSFEEYLLIAQDEPKIEVFRKTTDERWILTSYEGLDTSVKIETLGITLLLSEIYSN